MCFSSWAVWLMALLYSFFFISIKLSILAFSDWYCDFKAIWSEFSDFRCLISSYFFYICVMISYYYFLILFLLHVLIGNYAFLDLLVFVGHFLNVFSDLKDSTSESFVHLFIAWVFDCLNLLYGATGLYLRLDVLSLFSELIQFFVKIVPNVEQVLYLQNLRSYIGNLWL